MPYLLKVLSPPRAGLRLVRWHAAAAGELGLRTTNAAQLSWQRMRLTPQPTPLANHRGSTAVQHASVRVGLRVVGRALSAQRPRTMLAEAAKRI